tara:strand:- start:215 stop:598 length:384 start_codon:yes stop_codon:yes gene_type:complete
MSIQLVLLKSGEEVIADVKELRDTNDELVSYVFKNPYCVKIKTSQVLVEEKSRSKHELAYYKWMSLSNDDDIIVNKDWVVCITDPLETVKNNYEEKMNGRRSNDTVRSADGSGSATSKYDSSSTLSE